MTYRFGLALICGLLLVPGVGGAKEDTFDSNGVKIHYLVEGEGEPVLLIHGFAVNSSLQWVAPGIFKALAKDHRVIALDLRGHGKSDKPTDPKEYGTKMVEDVVRLLDHLKIKKAHVVGYSMGAVITGKLMVTHPDRVRSATLGGAGVVYEGMEWPPFIDELVDSLEKGKGIGPLLVALTPPGRSQPPEVVIEQANRMLVGGNGKALAAVVRSWKTLAVSEKQMKANKVPVLALIGEKDPLKKNVEDIKDRLANLQVVVIDGSDHLTAFTRPKFVKSLSKFLDEHRQKKKEKVPAGAGK
ncbi:MAG TPA: alpha/beta hydrolase [Gemmataceae bacterium]|jgi:pimeloyl-ACP methyl ester carboxylesterase